MMNDAPAWFDRTFSSPFPVDLLPNLRARLAGAAARLVEAVRGHPPEALALRPPGKWSAEEQVRHLVEIESLWLARVEDFIASRDQMTPAERAHFIEFFLADLPWSQAGVNYSGVSLIKPQLKATTGTVTATQGALTVTGNGTRFNTQVKPGDFIIMPGDSYAKPYLIASIESDTQLTVSAPVASATGPGAMANSTWQAAPRWNPSMYGFLWNQKHFIYNPLNGAGEAPPGSPYPIPSPYLGAYSGFYQVGRS